jgi:hypothetical protein
MDLPEVLARAGVFHYRPQIEYAGRILSPYRRTEPTPAHPRKLSELDPAIARTLDLFVFSDVSFVRDAVVQPARLAQCMSYVDPAPAYLDVDLRTVRPQRGMAETYRAMWDELQGQASEDWVFEDP